MGPFASRRCGGVAAGVSSMASQREADTEDGVVRRSVGGGSSALKGSAEPSPPSSLTPEDMDDSVMESEDPLRPVGGFGVG